MQCAFYLRAGAWRSCDLSEVIVLGSGGARHLVLGVKLRPLHQLSHVSDEMLSDPADSVPLLPFSMCSGMINIANSHLEVCCTCVPRQVTEMGLSFLLCK